MGFDLIVLATENDHKLKEFRSLWKWRTPLLSLRDIDFKENLPPEIHPTYDGNACQKAQFIGSRRQCIVIGDDSGLEIRAMNGAPGVNSARFANTRDSAVQRQEVLARLKDVSDRSARFVCCLSLYDPAIDDCRIAWGYMNGSISHAEVGTGGFGYDPIFIPEGMQQTVSELSFELKNSISHRAFALKALENLYDFQQLQ